MKFWISSAFLFLCLDILGVVKKWKDHSFIDHLKYYIVYSRESYLFNNLIWDTRQSYSFSVVFESRSTLDFFIKIFLVTGLAIAMVFSNVSELSLFWVMLLFPVFILVWYFLLWVLATASTEKYINAIFMTVCMKMCLSIIIYLADEIGLPGKIIAILITAGIFLLVVYKAIHSKDIITHSMDILTTLIIISAFWFIASKMLDIFSLLSFFSFEDYIVLFMGNILVLEGIDSGTGENILLWKGIDLSVIESFKQIILGWLPENPFGFGGPGGDGGPNMAYMALYNPDHDIIYELDVNKEPDSDLYPGSTNAPTPALSVLESIDRAHGSLSYPNLDVYQNIELLKNLSLAVENHNKSLDIPKPYEMLREKITFYNNLKLDISAITSCPSNPIDYINDIRSSSYLFLWEFDILTKAKLYVENKFLNISFESKIHEDAYHLWQIRQEGISLEGFRTSVIEGLSGDWRIYNNFDLAIMYDTICKDLIWIEIHLAFIKSFLHHLSSQNIKVHYLIPSEINDIINSVLTFSFIIIFSF